MHLVFFNASRKGGSCESLKKRKVNLTGEIRPVRGGAVDRAHGEAAEPVVV